MNRWAKKGGLLLEAGVRLTTPLIELRQETWDTTGIDGVKVVKSEPPEE